MPKGANWHPLTKCLKSQRFVRIWVEGCQLVSCASAEPRAELPQSFDAILCAGNVLGFVHPDTRRPVLAGFAARLNQDGRAVVGFGAGRGYAFEDFFTDVEAVGLRREQTFSTWDLRPFSEESGFVVAVLVR